MNMKSFARRTSRRCAFLGQSRWALLVATVVSAAPALALDDRYQLTASGDISSDDNLTRTGGGIPRLSDVLTTARVAASATLPDGLRSYSLGANVSQVRYARFTQQDYTAFGFNAGLSEAIGRDVQVELVLSQSQSLLPLNNFQALVRDVVTTRNESLQLREAMDARWSVVETVALAQTINSIGSLDYNDQNVATVSAGLDYRLASGSGGTVSVIRSTSSYPYLTSLPGVPDPSYQDTRLDGKLDWPVTPITTVHADVAGTHRSYNQLPAQNFNGLVGSVSADLAPGGPWSMGILISHDLGGTGTLASRVLTSDTLDWHGSLAWGALWSSNARLAEVNRHYSVDQPGFPAHQETSRQWSLANNYQPRRWLTLSLSLAGEVQRSNPGLYAFVDHRVTFGVTVQP